MSMKLCAGTIMTISKDRVKPSPVPDSWKLNEIFATGIVIGTYLALVTVLFYWVANDTSFFEVPTPDNFREKLQNLYLVPWCSVSHYILTDLQDHFGVSSLAGDTEKISSAVYLQVSIISQALIFVTRSQSWSFLERPGVLLMCAFVVAQLVSEISSLLLFLKLFCFSCSWLRVCLDLLLSVFPKSLLEVLGSN